MYVIISVFIAILKSARLREDQSPCTTSLSLYRYFPGYRTTSLAIYHLIALWREQCW